MDIPYYHEDSIIPTIGASTKLTPAGMSLTNHDTMMYYPPEIFSSAYSPNHCRVTSTNTTNNNTITHTVTPTTNSDSPASVGSGDNEHRCRWIKCGVRTATLDQLILHIREDHVGSGKPAYFCFWAGCPRSKKPFTKRHKMHNHMRTHTGERPFQCTVQGCSKRFSRPDSLSTHIKTHSNIRPYHCAVPGCGKAYFHSRSLRKHTRSHEEQQQQQKQQQQLNRHHQPHYQQRHNVTATSTTVNNTLSHHTNVIPTTTPTTTVTTSYPAGPDPRFFPIMDPSSYF
ncbi:hypothetical protein INT45_003418, partial [Circinella minor]